MTISASLMGYYLGNTRPSDVFVLCLVVIGFCAHYFGFALNDIVDHNIDAEVEYHSNPISNGTLAPVSAWIATITILVISILVLVSVAAKPLSILIYIISVSFSVFYNLQSKATAFSKSLTELSLGLAIGGLFLVGVTIDSAQVSNAVLIFGLGLVLVVILLNSVLGGLKDIHTDIRQGAYTFVMSMGVSIRQDGSLAMPRSFKMYASILQWLILICVICAVVATQPGWLTTALVFALSIYSVSHLAHTLETSLIRSSQWSKIVRSAYAHYASLLLIALPTFPIILRVFYLIFIVVLFAVL